RLHRADEPRLPESQAPGRHPAARRRRRVGLLLGLEDIRAARERIRGRVRVTPLLRPGPLLSPLGAPGRAVFKLESLQVTGSFKARGATNKLLSLPAEDLRGLATA